ncbi:hypothetical protein KM043_004993 [Ampulex compressa]|nr:hypothetical protein KM043_004993 [Ampulex compressa]
MESSAIVDLLLCNQKIDPTFSTKVHLIVYQRDGTNFILHDYAAKNSEEILEYIDLRKPTVMYIHGYLESAYARTSQAVILEYMKRGDVNVIAVDWSQLASSINYFMVARRHIPIGKMIAGILNGFSKKLDFRNFHVIGHSLGAHIAGNIGRYLAAPLGRITGLDPAYPPFYPSNCHLMPTDAKIVVALHTDAGIYGTPYDTGTVDFYANKGSRPQPGCALIGNYPCSHQRSVDYHAESINHPKAFLATKCSNVTRTSNSLEMRETVYYGDLMPENTAGTFCFTTNARSSFTGDNTG